MARLFVVTEAQARMALDVIIKSNLLSVERPKDKSNIAVSGNCYAFEWTKKRRWTDALHWTPTRKWGSHFCYRQVHKSGRCIRKNASPVTEENCWQILGEHPATIKNIGIGDLDIAAFKFVGSLTDNFDFVPRGLIKKMFILPYLDKKYQLVSYYTMADAIVGCYFFPIDCSNTRFPENRVRWPHVPRAKGQKTVATVADSSSTEGSTEISSGESSQAQPDPQGVPAQLAFQPPNPPQATAALAPTSYNAGVAVDSRLLGYDPVNNVLFNTRPASTAAASNDSAILDAVASDNGGDLNNTVSLGDAMALEGNMNFGYGLPTVLGPTMPIATSTLSGSDSTVDNAAVNYAAVNYAAVNYAAVNYAAVNNAAVNYAAVDYAAVDYAAVNNAAVDYAAVNNAAVNNAAVNNAAVNNAAVNNAAVNNAAVNNAAVNNGMDSDSILHSSAADFGLDAIIRELATAPPIDSDKYFGNAAVNTEVNAAANTEVNAAVNTDANATANTEADKAAANPAVDNTAIYDNLPAGTKLKFNRLVQYMMADPAIDVNAILDRYETRKH